MKRFILFFFRNLNYTNHPFFDHDLVYFGWINEVFTAKYNGPLKWGIAWPYYLAGNHLLPGSIIAVLSTFLQNKNLVTSIEIKYLCDNFVKPASKIYRKKLVTYHLRSN